jgi:flavin-dependent dehydrogenase
MPSDAIIVGAGPAGCVAAYALAQHGWHVTLIEQQRFPRDKVCGESLSALGLEALGRLHLRDRLAALHPARLARTILHAPDGRYASLPLPREMWGLSRRAMDAALLDAARDAGVRVLQPVRCERLRTSPTVELTVRHFAENRTQTLTAAHVLIADGKGTLLPDRPGPTADFGVKAHFANVDAPRDAVELFGVAGHYVGLAPVENDRANVAFSVPGTKLQRFNGDLDALWREVLTENRALARRFAFACRTGDWLASPLPRFAVRRDWPPNVIPLGNAAAALEPIGGEGMGLAIRSAELAAEALERSVRSGTPLRARRLRAQFRGLWATRRLACRALARLLSSPRLAGDVVDLARNSESVSRAAMAWMGKG